MRRALLTAAVLIILVLCHLSSSDAGEQDRLKFTKSQVTFDNQVIYREQNSSWHIYDTILNPGNTHILLLREYINSRGCALRDFKVLYLRRDPDKVPAAVICTLNHDINFDKLGMVEAYWAGNRRIAVRTAPLKPGTDKTQTGQKTSGTMYYDIVSP
ncbi:MAG: hypothetical protein AB2L14_09495 [Candidatus Xenobiia bacterium LiM19]